MLNMISALHGERRRLLRRGPLHSLSPAPSATGRRLDRSTYERRH
jgi:hypothetical protein